MKKSIIVKIAIIVVLILLIIASLAFYFFYPDNTENIQTEIIQEEIVEETDEVIDQEYLYYQSINKDYVAKLIFDSNIINEPVVKPKGELSDYKIYAYNGNNEVHDYENGCEEGACTLNDAYLRTDINGNFDLGGTIFMDYRNTIDDQNIIIYGHLFPKSMDENRELMFSPLELLLKQENYENNKYLSLKLKNETRRYEIVYVYLFNITTNDYDDLQYYRTYYNYDYYGNLDEGYYNAYIENIEKVKLYDTGIKLTDNDKTLTLQTCYEANDNIVEIVVCKQISE